MSHRERVLAAVEQYAVKAKACEACGALDAAAGWRRGARFGWWCSSCRHAVPDHRVPWEKPAPPPWRGPTGGDAA
jgi:hypothetical protein